jgi:DNA processing protein
MNYDNTIMETPLKKLSPDLFPHLLQEIPDRPKQLYVRGSLPEEPYYYLAVVGSRAISPYGAQVVRHIIEGLQGYPIAIVSGLAYGVDAAAHTAAMSMRLRTIAVPGSGLDWGTLYPRAHVALGREIVEAGGCLISEFEPTFKATDYSFPQRNRIMAGMSHATLMIEAKEKSGTLITAKLAVEYNRELLVVPGSIFSETSKGVHQFLRLGATAITCAEDVLVALGITARDAENRAHLRTDISDAERRVLTIVAVPCSRESLIEELALDISESNVLLSTMEIKGLIIEELGVIRIR